MAGALQPEKYGGVEPAINGRSKEEHDCDTCGIYQEEMWIQPHWVGIA